MSGFLGSYRHQIDEKGRLSLPAPFRRDTDERPLVLVQVHAQSLTLYPADTWSGVEERLLELLRRQPAARANVLAITANAVEVVPDRQGRILVPQRLLAAAGLTDSALLVGVIDRIEIWDPQRFEATLAERDQQFDRFTAQIFG
ncbi:MAG TPA: division/cell wall cluster transcriptional repressor MraZ [Longimicrobiaceae bacterium]